VLQNVPSGATRTVSWQAAPGEHGWYVETTGPYGGRDVSPVRTVSVRAPGAPVPGTPSVRGKVRVGSTVTADPGTWPAGTRLSYQWQLGGQPLPGATGATYRVKRKQYGDKLSVAVSGDLPWSPASTASSPAYAVQGALLKRTKPRVEGKGRVGTWLFARTGHWGPEKVSLSYRWYVGGKLVKGADQRRLRLTPAMARSRVFVKVTATKKGYQDRTVRSRATKRVVR
jgi:hypothetical protein